MRLSVFYALDGAGVDIRASTGRGARAMAVLLEYAEQLDGRAAAERAEPFKRAQWQGWVSEYRRFDEVVMREWRKRQAG